MTLAAFILGGALAWLHFEIWGPIIVPGISVWIAWMGVVSLALGWQSWRTRDLVMIAISVILFISYVVANFTWVFSPTPIMTHSARNVLVAGILFVIFATYVRWQIAVAALLYASIVGFAFAAERKWLFGDGRSATFIAWSYPDVAAGLQHAALLFLSIPDRERESTTLARDRASRYRGNGLGLQGAAASKAEVGREAE